LLRFQWLAVGDRFGIANILKTRIAAMNERNDQ